MRAVWAYFDEAQANYGDRRGPSRTAATTTRGWRTCGRWGCCRFTSLVYAHKPGMAHWLNDWSLDFAAQVPECLPTATFYPEDDVLEYVVDALERGARVFKVHLQVGDFDPRDPLLRPGVGSAGAKPGVPVRDPLRLRAAARPVHRSRTDRRGDGASSRPAGDRGPSRGGRVR